jgi:hypothetical protein
MVRLSCSLALLTVFASFGGVDNSFAQATSDVKPAMNADSSTTNGQDGSTPTKLRSLINALSGKWHLRVKFQPSGEMPSGFTGIGEETWHAGPGGVTFIEEEQIPTPAGQGYLLGIIWWDSKLKSLKGMECNNQLPSTCDLQGALTDITIKWDEKSFEIEEIENENGKKTTWHEVWSNITPTSFVQTGDVTQPDGSTTRFMTIQGNK